MNHVTLTHESWPIHSYVPQDQLRALHKWDSHFAHMNEWYHTYEYVNTHSCTCATGPAVGAAHMDESCLTQKSCHCGRCTYGWVMSHTEIMSHVRTIHYSFTWICHHSFTCQHWFIHMCHRTSCRRCTYGWVMTYVWIMSRIQMIYYSCTCATGPAAGAAQVLRAVAHQIQSCGMLQRDPYVWQSDPYMWQKRPRYVAKWCTYVAKETYVAICGKCVRMCLTACGNMWQSDPYMWQKRPRYVAKRRGNVVNECISCGNMWQMSRYDTHVAICGKWVPMCLTWSNVAVCGKRDPCVAKETYLRVRETCVYCKRDVYV